ncbi:MAG: lipoprotein signal peptidase [Sulfurospirillum sp.]|jgi:signal peptidase II|nr:lipoprotein signal peptidase [Sulfurospirillum sp.]MBP9491935.1 lipoprotein signal peptidase [Sulfurospirillum sp.]MBP9612553.1 lipoprotein signal peptidase [Sulfurospirillum sp.]
MNRILIVFLSALVGVFVIDQNLKALFLDGFRWYGDYFSLILTYNKGVAFSLFAFLEEYLKYLQLLLIVGVGIYLSFEKLFFKDHTLAIGIVAGAALSNVYDRFIHGGVVDYFFWHYGFEFAVFNFADVMINFGVVLILWYSWKGSKKAI